MGTRTDAVFTWISRLAGIVVLVVGLIILGVITVGFFGRIVRPAPPEPGAQVARTQLGADLHLAEFREIAGSTYLYAMLRAANVSSGSTDYEAEEVRNILFFDTARKMGRWLCPGNEQSIRIDSFLTDPPNESDSTGIDTAASNGRKAIGILLLIEESSGNGPTKQRKLVVASPDGRATLLTDQIDGLLGHHQMPEQSVLVFYVSGGVAKVVDYDIAAKKVRSDEKLSAAE